MSRHPVRVTDRADRQIDELGPDRADLFRRFDLAAALEALEPTSA